MHKQNKELSVDHVADTVEPPPGLASRTCAKIWATLDSEEECVPNSSIFLNSAFFSPETFLPPSFLLRTSEPENVESEIPKAVKNTDEDEDDEESPRSSGRIGLIASISVGILIAIFLFPMIEFVKRSTRSYVTENLTNEINRRVGQYEQIYVHPQNVTSIEETEPYNLALFGWQELHSEVLADQKLIAVDYEHSPVLSGHIWSQEEPPINLLTDFVWTDFIGLDVPSPLDTTDLPTYAYTLLVMPGQEAWIRSAYGQGILLKEGRVFVRALPSTEPAKK